MQTETHLTFHSLVPYAAIAAIGVGMVVFSVYSYAKTHRPISALVKFFLLFLRLLSLLAMLVCLAGPSLTEVEILTEKGWVLLMLDNSRSMLIKDLDGNQSRSEAVYASLLQSEPLLKQAQEQYRFERLFVGREVRAWDGTEPDWSDKSTAIGTAVREAQQIARGKKVAGIILVSDGANNYGPEPVQASIGLRELAAPLYVFGVGNEKGVVMKDAKAMSVIAPKKVFSGNQFPIDAELHFLGLEGESVDIICKFDGREIKRNTLQLASGQQVERIRFMHRATIPGQHHISVIVPPIEGEISDRNNAESTYIDVLTGGLNVLYLEGKLRPEFGFVRRSIQAAQNLMLTAPLPFQISSRERLNRWLENEDLNKYHVIILGDIPAGHFPEETLIRMERLVSHRGIGVAFLGGANSFGAGGYTNSPLLSVMPVEITPQDGQFDKPTRLVPTPEGFTHFLMALENEPPLNKEAWESLPALSGLNRVGRPKPAARVLAVSDENMPFIVVQEYGKGRSAAFMGDTTHRWVLGQEPEVAARHKKFWRQFVLWLASRDQLDQKSLLLSVDKFSYKFGERTRIVVEVINEKGDPVPEAKVEVTVQPEKGEMGKADVPVAFRDGHYEGTYAAKQEGIYEVRASASVGDEDIGTKKTRFRLTVPDREFDTPFPNLALLRNLAKSSGGSYHTLGELPDVLQEILDKKLATEIRREHHNDIWDTYPVFALFVIALLLEWIVRRQKGLV